MIDKETHWCSCNPLRDAQENAAKWDAIVRCGECEFADPEKCPDFEAFEDPEGFCMWGKRK